VGAVLTCIHHSNLSVIGPPSDYASDLICCVAQATTSSQKLCQGLCLLGKTTQDVARMVCMLSSCLAQHSQFLASESHGATVYILIGECAERLHRPACFVGRTHLLVSAQAS
jgi:hypothetical protein